MAEGTFAYLKPLKTYLKPLKTYLKPLCLPKVHGHFYLKYTGFMLHSYLKYTLDFGMKMPPRNGNLLGRGNHERTVISNG